MTRNAQPLLGMTKFPKSPVKYVGKSEHTMAQDPTKSQYDSYHFQSILWDEKIKSLKKVISTRSNDELREVKSRA